MASSVASLPSTQPTGEALVGSTDFVYAASGTPFAYPGQSVDIPIPGAFQSVTATIVGTPTRTP